MKIKDLDTRIRQAISDWAEERGQCTESPRMERFWNWLSWWILDL